jgi:3-deoxy-D-manno-octulosonic-acid transferase
VGFSSNLILPAIITLSLLAPSVIKRDKVLHYYFPFDLPLIVNRYVKKINPKICILLETNLILPAIITLSLLAPSVIKRWAELRFCVAITLSLFSVCCANFFSKGLTTPAYGKRIGERLGFVDIIPEGIIWVHCVSVGEFRAATVLIDALIKQYPQYKILVTSTTPTGSQAIRDTYQDKVLHYYFPFDLPLIVNRYVKKINPKICILSVKALSCLEMT